MGILVANLPAFGLPEAAYFSPAAWGGTAPADIAAWFATYVLVEGKMRGLFALLFGASMLLVVERAEAAGRSGAAVHYRRMAVLFVIGLVHLYGLWWGDILAHYALCGAIAYPLIRLKTRALIAVALLLVAWQCIQDAGLYAAVVHPRSGADGGALFASLNAAFGVPPASHIQAELAAYRGTYAQAFGWRWQHAQSPLDFLPILAPETLATMLLGMAGMKSGFLTGAWPRARYIRWAVVSLGVSLPIYGASALHTMARGFAVDAVIFGSMTLPSLLRSVPIIGYAALGIVALQSGLPLAGRIAAAGRVALTNYLATTLVMTTVFYGYGLGLFGHLPRATLYLLAPVAWAAMLGWSAPWLARHRYGPVEWLWRSLARGRVEPLLRSDEPHRR